MTPARFWGLLFRESKHSSGYVSVPAGSKKSAFPLECNPGLAFCAGRQSLGTVGARSSFGMYGDRNPWEVGLGHSFSERLSHNCRRVHWAPAAGRLHGPGLISWS